MNLAQAKARPAAVAFVGDASSSAISRTLRPARWAFLAILVLMLAAFGSADALQLNVAAIALFTGAACVLLGNAFAPALRPVVAVSVLAIAILGAWVLVQSAQIPGNPWTNAAWRDLAKLNYPALPSISAGRGDSLAAIVPIALPFAVFIVALGLWPTEVDALNLIRVLGVIGTALAAYGMVQLALSPEKVLFIRPSLYRDSLTATFLDRNSAAILFGCMAVLFLVRSIDLLRRMLNRQVRSRDLLRLVAVSISTLLATGALLLTQSQVGIGATIAGLAISAALAATLSNSKRSRRLDGLRSLRQMGLGVGVAAATALTVGMLAARALHSKSGSFNDASATCQLPGLVRMLQDNWVLGTGAGTFATTSPAYADPDCGIPHASVTTHSGLLEGWITLGLPFVAVAGTVVVVLAIVLLRGLAKRRSMRWVPIVGIGVLTTIATASVWDSSVQLPGLAALIATLLASVCAICLSEPQQGRARHDRTLFENSE